MEDQKAAMVRGTFAQIHLLHPFLDQVTLVTVIHALVSSHLSYCNVLYIGVPLKTIWKIQLVQNAAMHTVMCVPRFAHLISLLP